MSDIANAAPTPLTQPKIRRPGSGRTPGSFSFVKISLSRLNEMFKDPETQIVVGRKWAEQVGFTGLTTTSSNKITEQIQSQTPEAKASVTVTNFDDEESAA